MQYWVEKTYSNGRGGSELQIGKAIWSPQRASGGQDFYQLMRQVQPGDLVFHLVDRIKITGVSIVSSNLDDAFLTPEGTKWPAGNPGYKFTLSEYTEINPPFLRGEFLDNEYIREELIDILNNNTHLFYKRNLDLNQGGYITIAPVSLVKLWDKVYFSSRKSHIPLIENSMHAIDSNDSEGLADQLIGPRYWWLNSHDSLQTTPVGGKIKLTYYTGNTNRSGNKTKRRMANAFTAVKVGDILIGYATTPDKKIIAECKITQPLHGPEFEESIEYEKISSLENPISRDRLMAIPLIRNCAPLKSNTGSLYELKPEEYKVIKCLIDGKPVPEQYLESALPKEGNPYLEGGGLVFQRSEVKPFKPLSRFEHNHCSEFSEILKKIKFFSNENLADRFIKSLLTKPFVILTGNSGTGKTKIAELLAAWLSGGDKSRSALVAVGADWTDNRNVLGFVNHMSSMNDDEGSPLYNSTAVMDLLLEAIKPSNKQKPYFIILDEMNLSHVERYFSDFLSCMESNEDKGLMVHRLGGYLSRYLDSSADVPGEIALPSNVFVIGTVNVDETTYMFSPKVLDRSNVIEFQVPNSATSKFLESGAERVHEMVFAPEDYAEGFLSLSLDARFSIKSFNLYSAAAEKGGHAEQQLAKCKQTISEIFQILEKRHLEFGFRTMTEIMRYLTVDYELSKDRQNWEGIKAMDDQILQKILPKIHGSKRKIGVMLAALALYCEKGNFIDAISLLEKETKINNFKPSKEGALFINSHRKLCAMIETINRDQFVSFIQ